MADGESGAVSGGGPQAGAGAANTGTPPGTGGQQTPPAQGQPEPPKVFTQAEVEKLIAEKVKAAGDGKLAQADVDKLIGERAKRAEEATQAKILEALGVKSLDDLKQIKEAADKAAEDKLTAVEKAQKDLEKAQKQADEARGLIEKANAERDAALAQANEMLMRSAVLAEATRSEYRIKPEAMGDVWSFIKADEALLKKIAAKDGKPGEFEGVADALKELLKAKAYMVEAGSGQGTPRPSGRGAAPTNEPTKEALQRATKLATHDKF
jgi:hypothetical protein